MPQYLSHYPLTNTGCNDANKLSQNFLDLDDGITGAVSGTAGYLAKFTATHTVGDSIAFESGTQLQVKGDGGDASLRLDVDGSGTYVDLRRTVRGTYTYGQVERTRLSVPALLSRPPTPLSFASHSMG